MLKKLKNVHPGEILLKEFLEPMNISQYKLAQDLSIPITRINQICRMQRSISVDTAIRLGKYFGVGSEFWLNLQNMYETEELLSSKQNEYKKLKTLPLIKKVS